MFEVGTIVSCISTVEPLNGIVVQDTEHTLWQSPNVSMVLITSSGEFYGEVYPFQKHQLEIISETH